MPMPAMLELALNELQLQHGGGEHQKILPRPRPAHHVWPLALSAPVHGRPKFMVEVDGDIKVRDWADVIWAITTRMDPSRMGPHHADDA